MFTNDQISRVRDEIQDEHQKRVAEICAKYQDKVSDDVMSFVDEMQKHGLDYTLALLTRLTDA